MFNSRKKEFDYFNAFVDMINCSKEATVKLNELLSDFTEIEKKSNEIHDVEHKCDDIHHQIRRELNISFITPIDREDIIAISDYIDNITDSIEEAANLFDVFSITVVEPEAIEMCKLVLDATDTLAKVVGEFKEFRTAKGSKNLIESIIHVNRIEEIGDKLYRTVIKELYASGKPALEIMKWKEIYDTLEAVLDSCEDVANLLEGLAIKIVNKFSI